MMMIVKFERDGETVNVRETVKVRATFVSVFRDRLVAYLPGAAYLPDDSGILSIPLADVIWIAPETASDVTIN